MEPSILRGQHGKCFFELRGELALALIAHGPGDLSHAVVALQQQSGGPLHAVLADMGGDGAAVHLLEQFLHGGGVHEKLPGQLLDGDAAGFHLIDGDAPVVIGITGGSFYFFLQNTASAHTSAANVSILVSMSPILTVILAQLFSRRGEKLGKWVYIGAVVAIAGVVMVVLNGTLSFHLSPLGDLLALAAALMWAVYSILVKKYTERYDNFLVTRRVFLWAFLTSLPLVLLTDGLPSLTPLFTQPNILVSWLFLGVFGNAVCFAIWNIAFKRLGVVITNNYLYATPFVTVVAGWLLLGEKISLMCIIGAVLITLGVIFAGKSDS